MRSLEEVPEVWGSTGKSKEEVSFGAEKSNGPSKNRPKSDAKWGRARKKSTSQGKKRERFLEKSPEIGFKMGAIAKKERFAGQKNERDLSKNRLKLGSKRGKARKTEISGRKRWGGGEVKRWALLPVLQCYEVAKWG